ncbi:MAG TPA: hypothetical protein VFA91_08365, partial [Candidatus Polarisedimenticolia bacterium]|nr:hypothetical protein [Candidatus Polarisedimenticolia bacterium]
MRLGIFLAISCCSFVLAGCTANGDVLAETTNASSPRSLTCLYRDQAGACTKKLCTSTTGAFASDCAGYAESCASAGLNWAGGSQSG